MWEFFIVSGDNYCELSYFYSLVGGTVILQSLSDQLYLCTLGFILPHIYREGYWVKKSRIDIVSSLFFKQLKVSFYFSMHSLDFWIISSNHQYGHSMLFYKKPSYPWCIHSIFYTTLFNYSCQSSVRFFLLCCPR